MVGEGEEGAEVRGLELELSWRNWMSEDLVGKFFDEVKMDDWILVCGCRDRARRTAKVEERIDMIVL